MKMGINLKQRIGTDKRNPCFNVGLSAMSYAAQNSGESIAHGIIQRVKDRSRFFYTNDGV